MRKRYKPRQYTVDENDIALPAEEVFLGGELAKDNNKPTSSTNIKSILKNSSTPKSVDLRNYEKFENEKLYNLTSVAMNSLVEVGIAVKITENLFRATANPDTLMKLGDTYGSAVMGNSGITRQAGFVRADLIDILPSLGFQAAAMATGQYYLHNINENLKTIEGRIDKILSYLKNREFATVISAKNKLQFYNQKKKFTELHLKDIYEILNNLEVIVEASKLNLKQVNSDLENYLKALVENDSYKEMLSQVTGPDKYHPVIRLLSLLISLQNNLTRKGVASNVYKKMTDTDVLTDFAVFFISNYIYWEFNYLVIRVLATMNHGDYYEDLKLYLKKVSSFELSKSYSENFQTFEDIWKRLSTFLKENQNKKFLGGKENSGKIIDSLRAEFHELEKHYNYLLDRSILNKRKIVDAFENEIVIKFENENPTFYYKKK